MLYYQLAVISICGSTVLGRKQVLGRSLPPIEPFEFSRAILGQLIGITSQVQVFLFKIGRVSVGRPR